MKIDMEAYRLLGVQRPILDEWLREQDLLYRYPFEIQFGEGVHRIRAFRVNSEGRRYLEAPDIPATCEFDWVGPLPPVSVLERVREVTGWRS